MVVILYGIDLSPPCRAVLMTAKALGLALEYKKLDMFNAKEHLSESYLKKNPQHTVPLIEDEGKCIWDSHAIAAYLVEKYGEDDSLYPKDLYKRAMIDQRMYFNCGVLFPKMRAVSQCFQKGDGQITKDVMDDTVETYKLLEKFLETNTYVFGDSLSIADLCCITTVTTMQIGVPITIDTFPKISAWISRLQQLPYYKETNQNGIDLTKAFVANLKKT